MVLILFLGGHEFEEFSIISFLWWFRYFIYLVLGWGSKLGLIEKGLLENLGV